MNKETTCQDCAALPSPAYRTTAQVHVAATSETLTWVVRPGGKDLVNEKVAGLNPARGRTTVSLRNVLQVNPEGIFGGKQDKMEFYLISPCIIRI